MSDVLAHAQALIRCPSVTPLEAGALRYVEKQLKDAGFTCHYLTFTEEGTAPVDNLYARIGEGAPHICFAGHTDVVPVGDEAAWTSPPFGATVRSGMLIGRGACDMKGGVAASLAAALDYLGEVGGKPHGSISFLITGDEEAIAINGTDKVVHWLLERGERPDYCLLPECTAEQAVADTIKIGRRGSLSGEISVRGLQGHSAYPNKSRNPIPGLIKALSLLKEHPLDEGTQHFQPSNLEITSIDTGNPAHNVIPAITTARFNIRFNDAHTAESLKAWIKQQVEAALSGTGLTYALKYEKASDCFLTEPGSWVQHLRDIVEAETGKAPEFATNGGTSDARFIKDLCPVVEIGLSNATAHKVDECVSVADLEALTRIFKGFLRVTLGQKA